MQKLVNFLFVLMFSGAVFSQAPTSAPSSLSFYDDPLCRGPEASTSVWSASVSGADWYEWETYAVGGVVWYETMGIPDDRGVRWVCDGIECDGVGVAYIKARGCNSSGCGPWSSWDEIDLEDSNYDNLYQPSGPTTGRPHSSYTYSVQNKELANGHYQWIVVGGPCSYSSTSNSCTIKFYAPGTYRIYARIHNGVNSGNYGYCRMSPKKTVTISY